MSCTYRPSDSLIKCEQPCGTCKTVPLQDLHARDRQILANAENKFRKKVTPASPPAPPTAQEVKVVAGLASSAAGSPAVAPAPGESETADPGPSSRVGPCAAPAPSLRPAGLSAAAIGDFKGNPRPRRATRGVRANLKDRRAPAPDTNVWKALLEKRRGYHFARNVLTRVLQLLRKAGSRPVEGTMAEPLDNVACWHCSRPRGRILSERQGEGKGEGRAAVSRWWRREVSCSCKAGSTMRAQTMTLR